MFNLKLLSGRLEWAKAEKEKRDGTAYPWAKLARECGATTAAVSRWKSDLNGIDAEFARPLAAFLGVDPVWLETGKGSPILKEGRAQDVEALEGMVSAEDAAKLLLLFGQATATGRRLILESAERAPKSDSARSLSVSVAGHKAK